MAEGGSTASRDTSYSDLKESIAGKLFSLLQRKIRIKKNFKMDDLFKKEDTNTDTNNIALLDSLFANIEREEEVASSNSPPLPADEYRSLQFGDDSVIPEDIILVHDKRQEEEEEEEEEEQGEETVEEEEELVGATKEIPRLSATVKATDENDKIKKDKKKKKKTKSQRRKQKLISRCDGSIPNPGICRLAHWYTNKYV